MHKSFIPSFQFALLVNSLLLIKQSHARIKSWKSCEQFQYASFTSWVRSNWGWNRDYRGQTRAQRQDDLKDNCIVTLFCVQMNYGTYNCWYLHFLEWGLICDHRKCWIWIQRPGFNLRMGYLRWLKATYKTSGFLPWYQCRCRFSQGQLLVGNGVSLPCCHQEQACHFSIQWAFHFP